MQPAKGANQKTNNPTLKKWVPGFEDVDTLMDADSKAKTLHVDGDPLFAVRVAYQTPMVLATTADTEPEIAYPYTFEDALVFENLTFFSTLDGIGLVRKFREAIAAGGGTAAIGEGMYRALKDGKKAEFALDVLDVKNFDGIVVPGYIAEGLEWLLMQLKKKQVEILPQEEPAELPEQTERAEA